MTEMKLGKPLNEDATRLWETLIEACERNPDDEAALARLEAHAADICSSRLRRIGITFRDAFDARHGRKMSW